MRLADSAYTWPDEDNFASAAQIIRDGGIVAIPTESFYGLAADPFNEQAVARLYQLKHRDVSKPLLVIISEIHQLSELVREVPECYSDLMNRFWPGPLTLVFPAVQTLPRILTGGTSTIGVRFTSHPIAQHLITAFGRPITATSANISGCDPAQSIAELDCRILDGIQGTLNGGKTPGGMCSTIVGVSAGQIYVKRTGQIDLPGVPIKSD